MADLEIVFRTRAELAGAIATREELERLLGRQRALGENTKDTEAKLSKVTAAIGSQGQAFGGLSEKISDVAGSLTGKLLGALGLAGGGFELIGKALEKFGAAEVHVAKLDAALAQTGNLTDEYRGKLQALAHELSESTAKSGGEWLEALTRLTQFGARPETINNYAEAVKNLAGIMGGNLQEAAHLFSRAIEGDFGMLHRFGIRVTQTGDQVKDLDALMSELALRGGGQLEAQAQTLSGKFETLEHSIGALFKTGGKSLSDFLMLGTTFTGVADGINSWVEKLSGGAMPKLEGMSNAAGALVLKLGEAKKSMDAFKAEEEKEKEAASEAAAEIERKTAALTLEKDEADKMAEAQKKLALAQVADDEREGNIGKGAAAERRTQIESEFTAHARGRNIRLEEGLGNLGRQKFEDISDQERKAGEEVWAQEKLVREDKRMVAAQKRASEAEKLIPVMEKEIAVRKTAYQWRAKFAQSGLLTDAGKAHMDELTDEIHDRERLLAQRKHLAAVYRAQAVSYPVDLEGDEARLKLLKDKHKAATAAATTAFNEFTSTGLAHGVRAKGMIARAPLEEQALQTAGAGEAAEGHKQDAAKRDADIKKRIADLTKLWGQYHPGEEKMYEVFLQGLAANHKLHETFAGKVIAINGRLNQLQGRADGLRTN